MNKLFGFVGCSGSGKSTCMKFLSENFDIDCRELSARPFLNKKNGSYDKQMTDEIQLNIMYNNIEKVYQYLREVELENKNIAISRTPIDVLAYAKVLNKGLICKKQQIESIKYLKEKMIFLYTVPDFKMEDSADILRGMNEKIRFQTDEEIFYLIDELNIPFYTISGNIYRRQDILSNIMNKYNIKRNNYELSNNK